MTPKTKKVKPKFVVWVNTQITEKELAEKLDAMASSDGRKRSDFIRVLIRKEWAAREALIVSAPVTRVVNAQAVL